MVRIWTSKSKESFKTGDLEIHFWSLEFILKNSSKAENKLLEKEKEIEDKTA